MSISAEGWENSHASVIFLLDCNTPRVLNQHSASWGVAPSTSLRPSADRFPGAGWEEMGAAEASGAKAARVAARVFSSIPAFPAAAAISGARSSALRSGDLVPSSVHQPETAGFELLGPVRTPFPFQGCVRNPPGRVVLEP